MLPKRTALFSAHLQAGARMVDFGGWQMPVQYASILEEHRAVRAGAGLFDISHMGEIQVVGSGAERFLNQVLTNDIRKLHVGEGQYTLMTNHRGGVVDDLYVFRVDDEEYLLIVNASRTEADWDWLQGQLDSSAISDVIRIKDVSNAFGAVAVQGQRVREFINEIVSGGALRGTLASQITDLRKNQIAIFLFNGISAFVSRTGYTGEDGFEIVIPVEFVGAIWDKLLLAGRSAGLRPCGLGARDTLRTEMGYPLYGQELDENTTPFEAGLGMFVAMEKGEFVGRSELAAQQGGKPRRQAVAFQMTGKGPPPRPHYRIWSTDAEPQNIGQVTSGTLSPSLGTGIGLGYVKPAFAEPDTAITIEIRGQSVPARVVRKPVYRRPAKPAGA